MWYVTAIMRTRMLLLLLLCACPLFAQYGPPAKDLEDAQFFMREITRQLEPALTEARDTAQVFSVVARAHNYLTGRQPSDELDLAKKALNDFLDRREMAGKPLSRENQKTMDSVLKELELGSQPPVNVLALRERLHHAFVHNLERQCLKNQRALQTLEEDWKRLVLMGFEPTYKETMTGIAETAREFKND